MQLDALIKVKQLFLTLSLCLSAEVFFITTLSVTSIFVHSFITTFFTRYKRFFTESIEKNQFEQHSRLNFKQKNYSKETVT